MRNIFLIIALILAQRSFAETVISTRTIRPQEIVTISDIRIDPAIVLGAHSVIEEVIGKEARVTLYPGRAIMRGQLSPPALVERNQNVELVFERGGLRIVAEGRALGRGGLGDRIRVMNSASKSILYGTIASNGMVFMED